VHRTRLFVAILVLGCGALGACAGNDAVAQPSTSFTVSAKEMHFTPSTLRGKQGQTTITVHNRGTLTHTFSLNDFGIEVVLNPGQTRTVHLVTQPGTYTYVCRILDHEGLGMHGTLTVTPDS
jgi:plastocyanin